MSSPHDPSSPWIKALLLADTHGSHEATERFKRLASRERLDMVLLAGDFSDFGRFREPLLSAIKASGAFCAFVSGNHESPELAKQITTAYGFCCLDYRYETFKGITLCGIDSDFLYTQDRDLRIARFGGELAASGLRGFRVLLTHEPPAPWIFMNADEGAPAIRHLVQDLEFDLVVTGHCHTHEPRIEQRPGYTVVNPGPQGCIVKINPAKGKFLIPRGQDA